MQKIYELIEKLCPNGVEYKNIQELCEISRGKVMSKDFIKSNVGEYPVYSSQTENNGELGKISTYDFDGEYLTWTTDGANAGSVFYRKGKFSVTNVCGLLEIKSKVMIPKFLYYVLSIEAPKYVNAGMGNPKLMSNVMAKIRVAVPPLDVQYEIIHILDDFTLSSTLLSAELSTELKARKKQCKYYREKLLLFDEYIPRKSISELCNLSAGGDIDKKKVNKEKSNEYNIPVISNGIEENAIYGYTDKYKVEAPALTISGRGTIGYCELRKENFYPIVRLICVKPIDKSINISFLKYYIRTIKFKVPTTGIPQLTVPMISKYKIPVPPIEEQERIVKILDRFDKLCNDISERLSAEMEIRQKQYEYYRNKLLTFKELKVNE
mgnify:CR=1 FL=1